MASKRVRKNRRKKNEEVDRIKRMSMFGLRIETRDDFDENNYDDFKNIRREIKDKSHSYRIGPAPVTDYDVRPNHFLANYPGSLDGDLDDVDMEKNLKFQTSSNVTASKAGCRGLIMYFSKLGYLDTEENIDLEFVDSLLRGGADINFPDRHGQTCFHEIARGWHTDVAQFALSRGADIDKSDNYGRTPLHLAAAVNYPEMVFWLITNGAKIDARTTGELQTPIHYAAKYNAEDALKVLLHMGSNICDVDYKKRTPLFVAAETGRSEACRFLLEQGAPSGVYDAGGTSALALMVEKMPDVARIALGQFEMVDKALRKKYYYLNYLETDIWKNRKTENKSAIRESYAWTPLETICAYNESELIMHPVILRLIAMKWQLFGKYHTALNTGINLIYTILWTILGVTMPKTEVKYYYTPVGRNAWRIVLELIGVTMTVYFIVTQFFDFRRNERRSRQYRVWKTNEIQRDVQYCHERWPEEKRYLNSEIKMIGTSSPSYFKNGWNVFEMCTNIVMAFVVFTRIAASASSSSLVDRVHYKSFPILLIMLWLRFMRSCQCYQSLGPFITMLGHVITDTLKFGFLFFEFFIPYVCAFWILFGGQPSVPSFEKFNDVMYQVFLMTLVDEYERLELEAHDKVMAQTLVASYLTIASVVCVNLYIALMSQTFTRVYQNAKATAFMQQAKHLMKIESSLNKQQREKVKKFMKDECSPQVLYDTGLGDDGDDGDATKLMMYRLMSNVTEIKDKILVLMVNSDQTTLNKADDEPQTSLYDLSVQVETVKKQCDKVESNIDDLKEAVKELKEEMTSKTMLENTQLATMQELKEALRSSGVSDALSSSLENLDQQGNVDELIDKVVEAISQAFPTNRTSAKISKRSRNEIDTRTSSLPREYFQPPRYDDDETEYRSYSSDSFISQQSKRGATRRQRTRQNSQEYFYDPYAMQEFAEFQRFQQLRENPFYFTQQGRGYDPRTCTLPQTRASSVRQMPRTKLNVYTRPNTSKSLHNMPRTLSTDEQITNDDIADWHENSCQSANTSSRIQSGLKHAAQRNESTSEDDNNYQEKPKDSTDTLSQQLNVFSEDENLDQDDILVKKILARQKGEQQNSSSDEEMPMGNVKKLLNQYGINMPGVQQKKENTEDKLKNTDTDELKNKIKQNLEDELCAAGSKESVLGEDVTTNVYKENKNKMAMREDGNQSEQDDNEEESTNILPIPLDEFHLSASLNALAEDDDDDDDDDDNGEVDKTPLIKEDLRRNTTTTTRKKSRNTRIRGKIDKMKDTRL